jgi:hypothetical protein
MRTRAKTTVEECAVLEVRSLARAGYLVLGASSGALPLRRGNKTIGRYRTVMGETSLRLDHELFPGEGSGPTMTYPVDVVRTPTLNEGERLWFACPRCHKLAGKLYLPPGANAFLCRTCHDLTYRSRQTRPDLWEQVRTELPKLREEARNPRLGEKRRRKAEDRIKEIEAQVKRQRDKYLEMLPSALGDFLLAAWTPPAKKPSRPPAAPDAQKLPRGRPKEKRTYERTKPFHQSERRSPAEAFCVKCRAYSEPTEWTLVTFKNGRPAVQGVCPRCGSKVARIIAAGETVALVGADAELT